MPAYVSLPVCCPQAHDLRERVMRLRGAVVVAGLCTLGATAAAQAEPSQWADHRSLPTHAIQPGVMTLPASGTLTFYIHNGKKLILKAACPGTGEQTFRNGGEHGEGEVTALTFNGCKDMSNTCAGSEVQVQPTGLPWATILQGQAESFSNEWQQASFTVSCADGTQLGSYTGNLQPSVGDIDDGGYCPKDDADAHQIFKTSGSGSLAGVSTSLYITGRFAVPDKTLEPWRFPCPEGTALQMTPLALSPFGEHDH